MTNSTKTILISGGSGFVGSAVISHVIKNTHHKVINVDKHTHTGSSDSLLSAIHPDPRYLFEQADISNSAEIKRIFNQYQPTIVMHFSAKSHTDMVTDSSAKCMQTDIVGTYTFLEQAKAYYNLLTQKRKDEFRFHYISSDEECTHITHFDGFNAESETPAYRKESNDTSTSPYLASRAASDHIVRAWQKTFKLPTIITNCSTNYGPYHLSEKVIPVVIFNALSGKTLSVHQDDSQIRDWLYVDDYARALVLVALQGRAGETYNIGGQNMKRDFEVINKICESLDQLKPKEKGSYKEQISQLQDRVVDCSRHHETQTTKIKEQLGWQPRETFDSGISKTVEWYLNNENLWHHTLLTNDQRARL